MRWRKEKVFFRNFVQGKDCDIRVNESREHGLALELLCVDGHTDVGRYIFLER